MHTKKATPGNRHLTKHRPQKRAIQMWLKGNIPIPDKTPLTPPPHEQWSKKNQPALETFAPPPLLVTQRHPHRAAPPTSTLQPRGCPAGHQREAVELQGLRGVEASARGSRSEESTHVAFPSQLGPMATGCPPPPPPINKFTTMPFIPKFNVFHLVVNSIVVRLCPCAPCKRAFQELGAMQRFAQAELCTESSAAHWAAFHTAHAQQQWVLQLTSSCRACACSSLSSLPKAWTSDSLHLVAWSLLVWRFGGGASHLASK